MDELTPEALEEWLALPVTEFVLGVLRKGAEANEQSLRATLWSDGECNPEDLGRVKALLGLVEDIEQASSDDWNQWRDALQ